MRVDPVVLLAQDTQITAEAVDDTTRLPDVLDALPAAVARHMATCLRRAAYRALTAASRLDHAARTADHRGDR